MTLGYLDSRIPPPPLVCGFDLLRHPHVDLVKMPRTKIMSVDTIDHTFSIRLSPNVRSNLFEAAQSGQVIVVAHSIVKEILAVSRVNCKSLFNKRPPNVLKLNVKGVQVFG
jgi:hypothetical protein